MSPQESESTPDAQGAGDPAESVERVPESTRSVSEWWMGHIHRIMWSRQGTGTGEDLPSRSSLYGRIGVGISRLGLASTVLLLVAVCGLFSFRAVFSDRIYPAVVIGDVPVGGLTADEAEARVRSRATDMETGLVTFTYGGRVWSPTLSELGAEVDAESTVQDALTLGRTGDAPTRLEFANDLIRGDQVVPLRTTIDRDQLNLWFDRVDREIGNRAVNAGIEIVDGEPTTTPGKTGIVVDREAATAHIVASLEELSTREVSLPTVIEPQTVTEADLASHRAEIASALKSPIVVVLGDERWEIDPVDLLPFITVKNTVVDGVPAVELALDVDPLASFLNERFAVEVNRAPEDARVAWSDEKGLIAIEKSRNGATLKPRAFAEAINEGFLDSRKIDIPVVATRPEIDSSNLDELGITSRIGRGDSNFSGGDEARDTNIYIGAELANGTLVRPGEEYSFNGAIGPITEDKGYVVSNVIFGETPGTDIGGGICQISTTVFRAALMGGFPITELNPHSYRILNYEYDDWGPGFDASILQLGDDPARWGDLRFTNDTGGWLLVETWAAYPHVVVSIYGKEMNRTVDISNTWSSESEVGKLSAGFTRTVFDANGVVIYQRDFTTTFL